MSEAQLSQLWELIRATGYMTKGQCDEVVDIVEDWLTEHE